MENWLKIAGSFCYRHYLPHLLLAFGFCLLSGNFVSLRNLDIHQAAKVLEMYTVWVGIILLVPLFMPEQNEEIWQLEKTKKTPMWIVYGIRLMEGIVGIAVVVFFFLLVLQKQGSTIDFGKMWIGTFCETLFLGSIGFFVSAVTNQVIIGYMVPIVYFAVNIGKREIFRHFALFQMTFKGTYDFWYWMLFGSLLLIISGIYLREHK